MKAARLAVISMMLIYLSVIAIGQELKPLILAPDSVLHDELFEVTIRGLAPETLYTLRAEFYSRSGTIWRSEHQFKSDDNGYFALSAAGSGTGRDNAVSTLGLFWSMTNSEERSTNASLFESDDQSTLRLHLKDKDKEIARRDVVLRYRGIGVSTVEVRNDEVIGTFFVPPIRGRVPGIIVLGGSEGGIARSTAALCASHGYATLALAYFGVGGLPRDLERIPVETVDRAVQWLSKQPGVDAERILLMGGSKGAELALLAASRNPRIKGVIVSAPSSIVYGGIGPSRSPVSSWTIDGKEVPFAPYIRSETYIQSKKLIDLYDSTLAGAPSESKIAVENIAGPILLLSGKEDLLWPSTRMANDIERRLVEKRFKYKVRNIVFDDAGHHAGSFPLRPTADSVRLGGSQEGIAKAQVSAWREIVSFLSALKK